MGAGGKFRDAVDAGASRTFRGPVKAADESAVCDYAEVSLRLAYPGSNPRVTGAPDAAFAGVLDVRLEWPDEPPLTVRVVVHDEMARAAWREVSNAIGDAVRAALRNRCPAHPHPHTERK